jgi:hypothetical protein
MKKCSKCLILKDLCSFVKRKDSADGLRGECKSCMASKIRSVESKEKQKINHKNWVLKNKDKKKAYDSDYRIKNAEKIKKYKLDMAEAKAASKVIDKFSYFYIELSGIMVLKQSNVVPKKIRKRNYDLFFRANFKDKIRQAKKITNAEYKGRINLKKRIRRKIDQVYRMQESVSNAIRRTITVQKGRKGGKTWDYLPYSPKELISHIESLWEPWMDWSNYGLANEKMKTWQIDHIIPQKHLPFDSLQDENFLKCWSLSNLRPLDSIQNIIKGDKL